MRTLILLALLALLLGCGSEGAEPPEPTGPPAAAPVSDAHVAERVADAHRRLEGTEAGALLRESIDAHGGLARWLSKGTARFEFDYRPVGSPERRMHTVNEIDLWRSRARQEEIEEEGSDDAEATLGWDGERAWITPGPDAFPSPARFWATTPYYFVGIPFVLADPGTRHERMADAALDGVTHRVVKVTYESGTGDSPDDYYVIYLHPETHRVSAIRYVVAYPGFFPEGGHSPEKLMRYALAEVDGLWVPTRLNTYAWDAEAEVAGELVTEIDVSDYRFGETWPAERFAPAEGAEVSTEIERRE